MPRRGKEAIGDRNILTNLSLTEKYMGVSFFASFRLVLARIGRMEGQIGTFLFPDNIYDQRNTKFEPQFSHRPLTERVSPHGRINTYTWLVRNHVPRRAPDEYNADLNALHRSDCN